MSFERTQILSAGKGRNKRRILNVECEVRDQVDAKAASPTYQPSFLLGGAVEGRSYI